MTLLERNILDIMRLIPSSRLGFEPTQKDAVEIASLSGIERADGFSECVRKITQAIRKFRAKK